MNKFYVIILLFLVITECTAQSTANISRGKSYPYVESRDQYYVADKTGFLIIKVDGKKIILQKIGTDLVLQKALQYENFPDDFSVQQVLSLNGKCYIFYSAPVKKQTAFYAAQIDVARGELLDGGKIIVSPARELTAETVTNNEFQVMVSDDSNNFAVCYRLKPEITDDSKSYEVNGIWVFNNMLAERWHNEITLPYTEKKCRVRARGVDNNGNVHMALNVINDESGMERKAGEKTSNYSLEILSYNSAASQPKIKHITLGGKFLNSLSINGSSENISCSGFYRGGSSKEDSEGIFMIKPTAFEEVIFHPFPLAIANEGEGKMKQKANENRVKKNEPLEISELEFMEARAEADGSILIIGEQREKGRTVYGSRPGAPVTIGVGTAVSYGTSASSFKNIIVARLLPDGKMSWIRRLIKDQSSYEINPAMYCTNKLNDLQCFFFLEDDELITYQLNSLTGEGERQAIAKLKPYLKKPGEYYTLYPERLVMIPGKNGIVLEALLRGDAGQFGESKPYKEELLIQVSKE